jgi:hypothetical protein
MDPLDVFVYGSGFGEAVLLIWTELDKEGKQRRRAAFIDCYGGDDPDGHPALLDWRNAGAPSIALVAVTHPHLDHVRNAAIVIAAVGCNADTIAWWGGHTIERARAFYDKLRSDLSVQGEELGEAAEMTFAFLNELHALEKKVHSGRTVETPVEIVTPMHGRMLYTGVTPSGPIEFRTFSPSLGPQTHYTRWIDSQIIVSKSGRTTTVSRKGVANCTSLGFLVNCGNAQVLLGGDVEEDNWEFFKDFCDKGGLGNKPLSPLLIKVSHHGSSTGVHPHMWKPRAGFFGSGVNSARHCVVTPWRRGAVVRQLPNPAVIKEISEAGFHVWETGSELKSGVDRLARSVDSFIRFSIDPDANAINVVDRRHCRFTAPA